MTNNKDEIKQEKSDILDRLERLSKLKKDNVLTEKEFQRLKSQILSTVSNQSTISTTTEIPKINNNLLTYENPTYGIKIKYPSDLEGTELGRSIHDTDSIRVVEFYFPLDKPSDTYKGLVCLDMKSLSSKNMSLDPYSQQQIFHLTKVHKNFRIIESASTTLSNKPAYKILYTYTHTDPSFPLNIKSLRIWTIKNEKAYHILYSARADGFSSNLSSVQSMISSLEIADLTIPPDDTPVTQPRDTFLTYENSIYGITIQYPSDWIADERDYPADHNGSKVVGFLSPSETDSSKFEDRLLIEMHELHPPTDIDNYAHNHIDNIRAKVSIPSNFTLIESTPITLEGNAAKKIIYRTKSTEDQVKTMEVLTIRNDKSFIITYSSISSKYDSYLPIVEKRIESINISSPKLK